MSTEEQARKGISLAAQKDRCKAFATARGWTTFKVYCDGGFSAGNTNRPAFQLLLRDAQEGKFSVVLVFKIDRFSRRLKDLIDVLERLNKDGIDFSSVSEQFDTTTAMGEAFFHIIGAFAQLERRTIAERVQLTFEKRMKDGFATHRAPLGYVYHNRRLTVDPVGARIVRKIFNLRNAGAHYREIAEHTRVPVSTLYALLKNPIYIGKIRYKDELYGGQHDSIVDDKLFYSVNPQPISKQLTIAQF